MPTRYNQKPLGYHAGASPYLFCAGSCPVIEYTPKFLPSHFKFEVSRSRNPIQEASLQPNGTNITKPTYPFILPEIAILVIRRRQTRSRRAYCQGGLGVEVLQRPPSASKPAGIHLEQISFSSPSSGYTYLNDLIQLGMVFLLLQRAVASRRSGRSSSRSFCVRSQVDAGSCPLGKLVSRVVCVGRRWVVGSRGASRR